MRRIPGCELIFNDRPPRPRRSSGVALGLALALALQTVALRPATAQDTTKAGRDSVAARLERAEEAIKLLQQQLAAQAQTVVQTRSRMSLEFSGRVLVTGFSNSARVNNVDVPLFVRPDTASGLPQGGSGLAIRQTTLSMAVTAPGVMGGSFRGDVDVDFFGGQQASSGGRTFPLLRLRTARGVVTWPYGEMLIGQESPLISGVNPVSLASVGTPGFVTAGNLWIWLPQFRVGLHSTGDVRFGMQAAILAPSSGDPATAFDTDNDVAERTRRPFLEGRAHLSWGEEESAGEIGVGMHRGWFATKGDSTLEATIFAVDARVPFSKFVEVRGEWFSGRGARALGGGGIGQLFGNGGIPIRSTGAWGQLNLKPTARVVVGAGSGYDNPDILDLLPGARQRNTATEVHVHLRPAGPFVLGAEWRRLTTTYSAGKLLNDHVNLSFGFEF